MRPVGVAWLLLLVLVALGAVAAAREPGASRRRTLDGTIELEPPPTPRLLRFVTRYRDVVLATHRAFNQLFSIFSIPLGAADDGHATARAGFASSPFAASASARRTHSSADARQRTTPNKDPGLRDPSNAKRAADARPVPPQLRSGDDAPARHSRAAPGSPNCSDVGIYNSSSADNTTTCYCPIDRTGQSCELIRPFTCAWNLISPVPQCEPLSALAGLKGQRADQLDGDPVCIRAKLSDTIVFNYTLACTWTDGGPSEVSAAQLALFNFAAASSTFAVSAPGYVVPAIWKLFNFNMFSDLSGSVWVNVTATHLVGAAPVVFPVSVAAIPRQFYAGGRLYAETSFYAKDPIVLLLPLDRQVDRRFVDVDGAPRPSSSGSSISTGAVIAISATLGGLAFLIVVGLIIGYRRLARNHPNMSIRQIVRMLWLKAKKH